MPSRRDAIQCAVAAALSPLAAAPRHAAMRQESATLGTIRAVTITADHLQPTEEAWTKFMGYHVVSRGALPRGTAESWDAPRLAGKSFVILGPASGEPTYVRFVEQPTPADAMTERTLGWTTTEITVQNADDLYERLHDSPFKVRRPPAQIPTYPYLRAMQALGPAGERLNLTWITEPRADLAVAKSFVGRCFIAVLGAPDLPDALKFYKARFGTTPSAIRQLPSLRLAVVPLDDGTKIEVDHFGPRAQRRTRPDGGLPVGLAVVTFECSRLDALRDRFVSHPGTTALEPHSPRRSVTVRGPAGELLELLET